MWFTILVICMYFHFRKHYHERKTQNLGVPYYVKSDFHSEYKGSIRSLERHVEDDYLAQMRTSCFRERSYSMYNNKFIFSHIPVKNFNNIPDT